MPTRRRNLPLYANVENCSGRNFIVTGANTGLGFEAAKHLVAAGASKVIMAVRNVDSGKKAKTKIEAELGAADITEVWPIDLTSYASVRAFAARATTELDRIDALIANAGVYDFKRILAEGHVSSVTVNIVSTFLLAVLLLPKLIKTARDFEAVPHITVVSSGHGFSNEKEWNLIKDDPLLKMDAAEENALPIYALTKLVDIMAARQLAVMNPVSRTGVVINTVSPGLCHTELARNGPPEFQAMIAKRVVEYGRTAEDGSRTLLHAALAGKESHGHFLDSCEIADDKLPGWMTNEEGKISERRAWEVVAAELETIEPGCLNKVLQLHS